MKILVTEPDYFDNEAVEILKEVGSVECRRITREELLKLIEDIDILVIRVETNVDKKLLERAKKLKIIASATTGTNHIDESAKEMGIKIINLEGANTIATAEHTFALILSLARKIPWAFESVKSNEWKRSDFFGRELNGKTLGLVGFGRIGRNVGKYAKSFGMKIVAFDPYLDEKTIEENGAEAVFLEKLLRESDIISLHLPLTRETENMINFNQFKIMKREAILINASRGQIVNIDALIEALEKKQIAGAALDVLPEEPPKPEDKIIKYIKNNKNLIVTPHLGGSTQEAVHNAGIFVAKKIKEYSLLTNL